ncbi:MAG: acetyl ornithine aminotransferase family protein [Nitrospiria bacterium]
MKNKNIKKTNKNPTAGGPKARHWVRRDHKALSPSVTRAYPLVVESAKGSTITDVDGNHYLDFTAGIAVTASGHCHPKIIKAITAQAKRLIHMSGTDFYYPSEINLAETLAALAPGKFHKKVFFTNSGAESVEAAMKLTRYFTKRPYFIAFSGAFHGRTMGALSLTASKALQKKGFAPLIPGVIHAPYPNPYRPPAGLPPEKCTDYTLNWIQETAFRQLVPPEEVAAIFVEPIQGEGGYIVPPKRFLRELAKLAKSYGIVLVVDEIQTGMGRTGKIFASEHFGYVPEVMTLAKGIASGLPLGALIARDTIMDTWEPGSHANTFGGNPIACEAALATIDLLRTRLMKNAEAMGYVLRKALMDMQRRHRLIGDVRGMGLMIGIELVRDRETKEKAISERDWIVKRCYEKGLLVLGCGENVVRFMPPLTLKRKEAEKGLTIFEEVLSEVER